MILILVLMVCSCLAFILFLNAENHRLEEKLCISDGARKREGCVSNQTITRLNAEICEHIKSKELWRNLLKSSEINWCSEIGEMRRNLIHLKACIAARKGADTKRAKRVADKSEIARCDLGFFFMSTMYYESEKEAQTEIARLCGLDPKQIKWEK